MTLPDHLAALRDEAQRTSCDSWAIRRRWPLGRGIDRAGPCPRCGGKDRFSVHTKKNSFNCRGCGIKGHGVIDLVMATDGVDFTKACEIITGRRASDPVDEAQLARIRQESAREEERRVQEADRYREQARKAGYDIWKDAVPVTWADGWPVHEYLARRGLPVAASLAHETLLLREHGDLPWREKAGGTWTIVHRGPAMVAAVIRPDGRFGAVHQTWLDPAQPNGKLILPTDADGRDRPSKKVLGSKKGGAIRLYTPEGAKRIVMGEGIETTLTALIHAYEPDTAYWAGVDVGNMAGRAFRDEEGRQVHGEPDMTDHDCFLPPEWCEDLIYLCDGDDADRHTEDKMARGLERARRLRADAIAAGANLPALDVAYVPPLEPGKDLNDLVRPD
jgi:hypothetical protein